MFVEHEENVNIKQSTHNKKYKRKNTHTTLRAQVIVINKQSKAPAAVPVAASTEPYKQLECRSDYKSTTTNTITTSTSITTFTTPRNASTRSDDVARGGNAGNLSASAQCEVKCQCHHNPPTNPPTNQL